MIQHLSQEESAKIKTSRVARLDPVKFAKAYVSGASITESAKFAGSRGTVAGKTGSRYLKENKEVQALISIFRADALKENRELNASIVAEFAASPEKVKALSAAELVKLKCELDKTMLAIEKEHKEQEDDGTKTIEKAILSIAAIHVTQERKRATSESDSDVIDAEVEE